MIAILSEVTLVYVLPKLALSEVTLNLHLYLFCNAIAKSKKKTINQKS